MLEDCRLTDMDLFLFQYRRHRHNHREFFDIPLEVIGHRDDGLVVMPCDGYLGGFIEEFGIGLGHIEAAESRCVAGPGEQADEQCECCRTDAFHENLLGW